MTPTEFRKLDWRKQNDWLEPFVIASLQSLRDPIPTTNMILDVANRAGWLDPFTDYLPGANVAIGNVLRRFMRHKPGWAKHDGELFTYMGKETRRWMWQPQPKAAPLHDVFS